MLTVSNVAVAGFVVGFVGDAGLNFLTQVAKVLDAGLVDYFPLHGTFEALCIAGGLVALVTFVSLIIWTRVFKMSLYDFIPTAIYLFIFGAVLDLAFRYLHLMPTLDGMYEYLSIPVSMFFAGSPLVAAYVLAVLYDQYFRLRKTV